MSHTLDINLKQKRSQMDKLQQEFCLFKASFSVLLAIICFLFNLTICYSQLSKPILKVGDSAPEIRMHSWLKGVPVNKFVPGHIYVLEFGSVSCGPCRASIPLMSEISKKYSRELTLISIYVYENGYNPTDTIDTSYVSRVESFIQRMDSHIEYTVGVDDPKQTMAKTWMKVAKQNTIPTSFIVNGDGKVVWIGHPTDLEVVIKGVIEKDPLTTRRKEFYRSFLERFKSKSGSNFSIEEIDSLIKVYPEKEFLNIVKFNILDSTDYKRATLFAVEVLQNQCKDIEYVLTDIATKMLYSKNYDSSGLDVIVSLTERAFQLSNDEIISASILALQSQAYYKKGNVRKAIKIAEEGLMCLKDVRPDSFSTEIKDHLEEQISVFKSSL